MIVRRDVKQDLADYGVIVSRHVVTFVSFIFATLIIALASLGERQDAVFLASVLGLNILIGIVQEVRAKRALDRLRQQVQPVAHVVVTSGKVVERSLTELSVGDTVRLQRGDQVPGDGHAVRVSAFEVNEAFLTGESLPVGKRVREEVFAGSFVTSGSADIVLDALGEDTRLGRVEDKVTRLRWRTSEIQRAVGLTITVMSWGLIAIALALASRSALQRSLDADLLRQVAAIAATIVPEGLLLATTIFFAYGAVRLFRWRVLLQQINAVETLGRVQILCLDKTGTLTEDRLSLIGYRVMAGETTDRLKRIFGQYLSLTDPQSEMAEAYRERHASLPVASGKVITAFSSERKFGQVKLGATQIWVGAPDQLIEKVKPEARQWVEAVNAQSASVGERVLLVATQATSRSSLQPIGVVRFAQPIKPTAKQALKYFRARGVRPIIISGDQPATVMAIAQQLGWGRTEAVITGDAWAAARRGARKQIVAQTNLFARVTPQHKEQIIIELRKLGTTAMTGDGANDALALRRADLGVSMFSGADITRTVADVVLVDNEFRDLPNGVQLSDEVITTLELVAVLFFSKVVMGVVLVAWAFWTATSYALSPRQMTLLNYFLIGLPIVVWAIWPVSRRRSPYESGYWSRILPYVGLNGLALAIGMSLAYGLAVHYGIDLGMTLFFVCLVAGLSTFLTSGWGMHAVNRLSLRRRLMLVGSAVLVLGLVATLLPVRAFFDIAAPSWGWLALSSVAAAITVVCQLVGARLAHTWYGRRSRLGSR